MSSQLAAHGSHKPQGLSEKVITDLVVVTSLSGSGGGAAGSGMTSLSMKAPFICDVCQRKDKA
jgi:hypothetical protein